MPGRLNRNRPVREEDVQRWIDAGFGQGEGASYKPWISVRDVSSCGRSHRPPCLLTGREKHLLSDREMACFLNAVSHRQVIDIREQFALLPRTLTEAVADELGIRHPVYIGTNVSQVMTTDLLLTIATPGGADRYLAISVKPASKLRPIPANRRVFELAEIERRFWTSRGIPWRLFSDCHINKHEIRVLELLYYWRLAYADCRADEWLSPFVLALLKRHNLSTCLKDLVDEAASRIGIPPVIDRYGLLAHAVWLGLLNIDRTKALGPLFPLHVIE